MSHLTKYYLTLLLLLPACSVLDKFSESTKTPTLNNEAVYYFNDMVLSINGQVCWAYGFCVAPKADRYAIKIETLEEVDQIVVSTLKRTDTPRGDQIKSKRGYTYDYVPSSLEKLPGSTLKISGYSKARGKIASGMVVFEHDKFQLEAGISCNATVDYRAKGVSICQAMEGQRMRIWFLKPVRLSPRKLKKEVALDTETDEDRRCQLSPTVTNGNKDWVFEIPNRECQFLFETESEPYQQFLLFTVGAEEMPIRQ